MGVASLGAATDKADTTQPASAYDLQSFSGRATTGHYYKGFAYSGAAPLTGRSGQLQLRFAESRTLLSETSKTTSPTRPDQVQNAWQIKFETAPKQGAGARLQLNWVEVDRQFAGGQDTGFSSDLRGVRQRDIRAAWTGNRLSVDYGRDRLDDGAHSASFSRDQVALGAYGFSYQRESARIDGTGRFGDGLAQRLIGKDGYQLADHKLGSAKTGYTDLVALSGMSDRFQAAGYKQGSVAIGFYDRQATLRGNRLFDRREELTYGGLRLTHARRGMDPDFTAYSSLGYTDWARLVGGREDLLEAAFDSKRLQAGWSHTRLRQVLSGSPTSATLTDTGDYKLLVQPLQALSLGYRHTDIITGAESVWQSTDRSGLTRSHDDRLDLGWTLGVHSMTVSHRQFGKTASTSGSRTLDDKLAYSYGKRTRLDLSQRVDRTFAVSTGTAAPTLTRKQKVALTTALGPSFAYDTTRVDQTALQHHLKLRFDRTFIPQFGLGVGYETWHNAGDATLRMTGRSGFLSTTDLAHAFDWRLATQPLKTTGFTVWRRALHWNQLTATTDFAVGAHELTETGVQVSQSVVGDFKLRARWSRFEKDRHRDADRREMVVAWEPSDPQAAGSSVEVGYRELRNADGHTVPGVVATARMRPYKGLDVKAQLARNQTVGAAAVAEEWSQSDAHTVQFAAEQKLGKDGKAGVSFSEAPGDRATLAGQRRAKARDLLVVLSTPSDLAVKGLKLTGQYHAQTRPGSTVDLDEDVCEHQASLSWTPGGEEKLLASFRLRSLHRGTTREGDSRFELQYSRRLGTGQFSFTGQWGEDFDPIVAAANMRSGEWERFRFGVQFTSPF